MLVAAVVEDDGGGAQHPQRRLMRERLLRIARQPSQRQVFARRDVRVKERIEVIEDGHPVQEVALRKKTAAAVAWE